MTKELELLLEWYKTTHTDSDATKRLYLAVQKLLKEKGLIE